MRRVIDGLRRVGLYAATLLMIGAFPVSVPPALAESIDQAAQSQTTPATTDSTATATPPTTQSTTAPTTDNNSTYDAATGRWNTDQWQYSSQSDSYQPTPQPAATTAEPAVSSPATTTTPATSSSPTPSSSTAATANTTTDTSLGIGNNLQSTATTGNAGVIRNTTGGSATTGNALAQTTQTNLVNSSLSGGVAPATFTSNINGDVNGDIMLYPMIMAAMMQAAAAPTSDTTITSTNATGITNNLNLAATSGDATVANNTSAGSATSGNAAAVANIVNMINSVIASGSSFVGTINIYGNLTGDILVSPDFIPQLLASNQGANLTANLSDTQAITNNVNLVAASGEASVANNTSAGNATTGSAGTNLVLLNLTGHQVVAKDSLLVFVNVLGTWVGMIVDAAPGSTSAAIGDGVTSNTTTGSTQLDSNNTSAITNNLTLSAQTGDATVTGNTSAGGATTGNATASANIANISQTNIGLSGWFGVLFINVFGSWMGSFGVDTPNGNPVPAAGGVAETPGRGSAENTAVPSGAQAIRFIAHQALSSRPFFVPTAGHPTAGNTDNNTPVIAASGSSDDSNVPPSSSEASTMSEKMPATLAPKPAPTLPTIVPFSMAMLTIVLAGVALRRLIAGLAAISLAS